MDVVIPDLGAFLATAHGKWLRRTIGRPDNFYALFGAVDTGKTTLLEHIAETQPFDDVHVVYWDLGPHRAVLDTPMRFWSAFAALMGQPDYFGESVDLRDDLFDDYIDDLVTQAGDGTKALMVILDHWDLALTDPFGAIDQRSLTLLDKTLVARAQTGEGRRCALTLVTQFPNTSALVAWGREHEDRSPGLHALSKVLERRYMPVNMPFLSVDDARQLATRAGLPARDADPTGGWLGPIIAAGAAMANPGASRSVVETANTAAWLSVQKVVLPFMKAEQPPAADEPDIEWFARKVDQINTQNTANVQRSCRYYSLPTVEGRVAPIIGAACPTPAYLWVDLENCTSSIRGLQCNLDGAQQKAQELARAITRVAEDRGVPARHVVVAARGATRAIELLGVHPREWTVVHTMLTEGAKRAKGEGGAKDNSDDVVLTASVASTIARYPFSKVYLLSSDKDFWGAVTPFLEKRPDVSVTQLAPALDMPQEVRASPRWQSETDVLKQAVRAIRAEQQPVPETVDGAG